MDQTHALWKWLLDETGLDETTQDLLRRAHSLVATEIPAIVESFYNRVQTYPQAPTIFQDRSQLERLRVSFQAWLNRILQGPWDEDYIAKSIKVGQVHVQVGLPQPYMNTAMTLVRQGLRDAIRDVAGEDAPILCDAVGKVLDLELALMTESYRAAEVEQMEKYRRAQRLLLEQRIHETDARFRLAVELSQTVFVEIDKDGLIRFANRVAEEGLGLKVGEEFSTQAIQEPDQAVMREALERAMQGDQSASIDATTTGGAPFSWRMSKVEDADTVYVFGHDVSRQTRLREQKFREQHLAHIGTLAAGLAHEVRNPLNSAKLQGTLAARRLRKAGVDEDSLQPLARIENELDRLQVLVNDFLAVARPSKSRMTGGDLAETVRSVIDLVEPEFSQAGTSLLVSVPDSIACIYDEHRIKQVLLNLLRNAKEAAPRGRVSVRLSSNGDYAIVEIADNGDGPPDHIDPFAPFATSKSQGTGLGLALVKSAISEHHGDISLLRRNGETVAHFAIPRRGPATL